MMFETDFLNQILYAKPHISLALFLIFLGVVLKRSRTIRDNWIPGIQFTIGAILFPIVAKVFDQDYTASMVAHNVLIGAGIGGASVGFHQLLSKKMPMFFNGGHTEFIRKDSIQPPSDK